MALKIVYKICCGIDVHKNFVVACIAKTDKQGVTTYERHHFSCLLYTSQIPEGAKTQKCSTSDPESGWFRKGEHKHVFAYAVETAVSYTHLDVYKRQEPSPARTQTQQL